ncbi:hypothetical protein P153DRAFT_305699 [Dothidotthia symphoricarpi CBS 119687]|uniref:BTB domain-containing protein n=1 Tax=Dothidotthia symphoricarpi CBS 119687 TaxID=1392245 RepID=A0A6A6AT65_9PLEO|nr:uncharacterized protein P153DRAFT_305699 [Dothidotthia symphoricarpi CBS 119687]KAF2134860.1 hypothetical protein P153DRAFT_305699 [Dothidotthia symphoricarpi CBS 119687]
MNQAEDVEVILGHKRRYKFHSGTLARNSTLFAGMLTEPNAAKLSNRARGAGIQIRWMIELSRLPCDQYPAGCLELVELTTTGERVDGRNGLIVNENGRIPQAGKAFGYYESIFYAFYNRELTIDDSDMHAALSDCYQLLQISDYLGCTGLISKPIEVALLKHGQDLFRAIQGAPYAWIEMAHRIRSELIFKECIIHLVGNWKTFKAQPALTERLRDVPGLRTLVEKYHRVLLTSCRALELGIMSLYPGDMRLPVADLPIKREAYAKDILVWMGLTFFRHCIAQRLIMEKGRAAPDCGFELYSQLGAGGDAYLDKTVITQFHTRFPMTKKALNVLENHILEIKACMKRVVEQHGLLKSNCQLDVHRFPVGYLTCVVFKREDFPWLGEAAKLAAKPMGREYKAGGNEISRLNLATAKRRAERSLSGEEGEELREGRYEEESDGQSERASKRGRYE